MSMQDDINVTVEEPNDSVRVDPVSGNVEIDQDDGGVVVQFGGARDYDEDAEDDGFYDNLADDIDGAKLASIANDLIDAIQEDDRSRQPWLETRARGLDLLGLKLEQPKSTVGDTATAMDGISSVTNPLLLDALLRGWANATGEMLPAVGPVKIQDDGNETAEDDDLAESLERDANHYLTKIATEYYPDTSHMLLWGVYFGGSGFKKIYRCPLRRRPVSESVDPKDIIVSDATKDFGSCGRITHQTPMRPSIMKRMQFLGAYRDVALTQPTPTSNAVTQQVAEIQGTSTSKRPEDQPYTIWETQCELDLPEFAPTHMKNAGVPLPYIVTIDKDSREILAIRRDWKEDDEHCERKRMYVKYPYVPGPGFYGTGLLNILGNSSAAMTAAWREALDAGMMASFPGGLMAKLGTRQNSANFRMAPGEFAPIETNGQPIANVVMGMPYRDVTAGLMAMMDKVTAQAQSLGGAADIPSADGVQNVPVGTMMAQIEQASKVISAAHRGMHTAQEEEIDLLLDLFREHPEDFWRGNKVCPQEYWNEEKFIKALNNCRLVPRSDPNVPSHIHRVAKATALAQLITVPAFTPLIDPMEALKRILGAMREDPNGLVVPMQPPGGPSPIEEATLRAAKAKEEANKVKAFDVTTKAASKAAEMASKEKIATVGLAKELLIHGDKQKDAAHNRAVGVSKQMIEHGKQGFARQQHADTSRASQEQSARQHALEVAKAAHQAQIEEHNAQLAREQLEHDKNLAVQQAKTRDKPNQE